MNKLTLSIHPNTRGFGYALMNSPRELVDYGIVTIRPICNSRILKRVKKILEEFKPTLVILENAECNASRRGRRVKRLIRSLKQIAQNQNISVIQYPIDQVQQIFAQFGVNNKYERAKRIMEWLPELEAREPNPRKIWMPEDYNMGIFDAVSLLLTHYYLLEEDTQSRG